MGKNEAIKIASQGQEMAHAANEPLERGKIAVRPGVGAGKHNESLDTFYSYRHRGDAEV